MLRENAMREANTIRDNFAILISQLPSEVQKMKVWFVLSSSLQVSDFCKTFGFELIDGDLFLMEEDSG